MLLTTVSYMYAQTASLAGHREYYIWTQKLKTESMLMVKKKKKKIRIWAYSWEMLFIVRTGQITALYDT